MLKSFFDKLEPRDIIACLILVAGFTLLYKGLDGIVGGCVIAVVAAYFGWGKKSDKPKTDGSSASNDGI